VGVCVPVAGVGALVADGYSSCHLYFSFSRLIVLAVQKSPIPETLPFLEFPSRLLTFSTDFRRKCRCFSSPSQFFFLMIAPPLQEMKDSHLF